MENLYLSPFLFNVQMINCIVHIFTELWKGLAVTSSIIYNNVGETACETVETTETLQKGKS